MKPVGWLLILLYPSIVQADIFTWTDAEGRVHYGDRPPADSMARQLDPARANVSTIGGSALRPGEWETLERIDQRRPQPAPTIVVPPTVSAVPSTAPPPPPARRIRLVTRYPAPVRYYAPRRRSGFQLEIGNDSWRFRLHGGDSFARHPYPRRHTHRFPRIPHD